MNPREIQELRDTFGSAEAAELLENLTSQQLADFASQEISDNIDIQQLIKDTAEQNLINTVDDAQEYLSQRYRRFKKLGVDSNLARMFERLDDISPGLPQEYRMRPDVGGELRYATQYELNPLTGVEEVVPVADPTDPRKALTLYEGSKAQARRSKNRFVREAVPGDRASEYVQRQILRRRGDKAYYKNAGNSIQSKTDTDFIIEDGKGKGIPKMVDGQTANTRFGANPQLYTRIDQQGDFAGPRDIQSRWDRAKGVQERIIQGAKDNPNLNLEELVRNDPNLVGTPDKYIQGEYKYPTKGKVLDTSRAKKDTVLNTVYDLDWHRSGAGGDTISKAPLSISEDDMEKARRAVRSVTGEEIGEIISAHPNSASAKHLPRTQINLRGDSRLTSQFRRDETALLKSNPELKQFLDYDQKPLLTMEGERAPGQAKPIEVPATKPVTETRRGYGSGRPSHKYQPGDWVAEIAPTDVSVSTPDTRPESLKAKPKPGTVVVSNVEPTFTQTNITPERERAPRPQGPFPDRKPRTPEAPGSRTQARIEREQRRAAATDFQTRDAVRRTEFNRPGRAERIRRSQGLAPRLIPEGEGGFVRTGAKPSVRMASPPKIKPLIKGVGGDMASEVLVAGGLSYLTGESDNPAEMLTVGLTAPIVSDNTGSGTIRRIGGKDYIYDASDNSLRDADKGMNAPKMGLAVLGGKDVAVPYGSAAGEKSAIDIVKDTVKDTGTAITQTVRRREQEQGVSKGGSFRGEGRTSFKPPQTVKVKPRMASPKRVLAVLNGKEGYMLKGDSSSFRMSNWSDEQRKKYYGK